jgi:diguanylate cyclase (GGDEF)-like protein
MTMGPRRLLNVLRALPALTAVTALVFGSFSVLLALNAAQWHPGKNPRDVIAGLAVVCVLLAVYVLARGKRFTAAEALVLVALKLYVVGRLTWNTDSSGGAIAHGAGLSIAGVYVVWFLHPVAGRLVLFFGASWWFVAILHQDKPDLVPLALSLVAQAIVATEVLSMIKRHMDHLARTDPLTGALNRLGISRLLERELAKASRDGAPLCVIAVDLDGLRTVNNTLGHAAGDELLASTSRHWQAGMRRRDALGRIGGDEFVLILPSTAQDEADQMMRHFARTSPGAWSAGVATALTSDTVESILRRADQLMYVQKAARQSVPITSASPAVHSPTLDGVCPPAKAEANP